MNNETDRLYDALLIVRYQSEDDAALDELVQRHEARVRHAVSKWLGAHLSTGEDICQQVWLAVVQGLRNLERPMAFEAWLHRIIRAKVALFIRRRERVQVPLDAVCDLEDPHGTLPSQPVQWEELGAAVRRLGEPNATMLRMRFWDDCSYQEIADAMQVPIGTVRSRLHAARLKLAKHLTHEER